MAFAIALQSVHDLPEGHGQTILTATISIVVLSVRYQTVLVTRSNIGIVIRKMILSLLLLLQAYSK